MKDPPPRSRLRLVVVCGPKGSGKTTAARFAGRWLGRQGRSVKHVTFFRLNTAPNLRRVVRLLVPGSRGPAGIPPMDDGRAGSPGEGPGSPDILERGSRNVLLRNLTLLLDITVFRVYLVWLRARRFEVAVCDRYFYDAFARAIKSGTRIWGVVERWTPEPDAAFALSVDPTDGVRRRPRYDERHFRLDEGAYLEVSRRFPSLVRVPAASKRNVHEALVHELGLALPRHPGDGGRKA
jgi:thymidylate kinase